MKAQGTVPRSFGGLYIHPRPRQIVEACPRSTGRNAWNRRCHQSCSDNSTYLYRRGCVWPIYTSHMRAFLPNLPDKHLQALQSLSAHVKLLLDAPEHLWRLMEKKVYLNAAWLFLLARVVHRALSQEDDDQSWQAYGIDVAVCLYAL